MGKVLEMISAQQPKEENDVWMVGEQLKEIAAESPEIAELLALADPDAVLFRAAFGRVQEELARAWEIIGRIGEKNPEKAAKFGAALVKITENGGKK